MHLFRNGAFSSLFRFAAAALLVAAMTLGASGSGATGLPADSHAAIATPDVSAHHHHHGAPRAQAASERHGEEGEHGRHACCENQAEIPDCVAFCAAACAGALAVFPQPALPRALASAARPSGAATRPGEGPETETPPPKRSA